MCCAKSLQSYLTVTPWTVAWQAPLSMKFSRQEYWSWVAYSSSKGSSWPRDQMLSLTSLLHYQAGSLSLHYQRSPCIHVFIYSIYFNLKHKQIFIYQSFRGRPRGYTCYAKWSYMLYFLYKTIMMQFDCRHLLLIFPQFSTVVSLTQFDNILFLVAWF